MKRRMLLAAVGDYRGLASTLVAPVQEVDRWERLLKAPPYNLVPIGPALKDANATRDSILAGLAALFTGAEAGDQLVFVFLGHGSNLPVRGRGGNSTREQVIITYPDTDLRSATIGYSDIRSLLDELKPHEHADITFVIESCYAQGTVRNKDVTPLFVSLDAQEGRARVTGAAAAAAVTNVLAFADLQTAVQPQPRVATTRISSRPEVTPAAGGSVVVLAASGRTEAAYQIREAANRFRLVFSMRALARLRQTHESFDDLVANINPLRQGFPQHAEAHGDPLRLAEKIPGEHPASVLEPGREFFPLTPSESSSIHMRVLGLGCFIEPRVDSPFLNRIVLPRDTVGIDEYHHFAFVEVPQEDLADGPGSVTGTIMPDTYSRGGVLYDRWTLSNHRVWLFNGDDSQPFSRTNLFQDHVPSMPVVCPELTVPREACYDDFPDPQWFTGFIDIAGGRAEIGPLEDQETHFTRKFGDVPTGWSGFTPRYVNVEMFYTTTESTNAILLIADEESDQTAQIFLKPGAHIMAGNAREIDLTGPGLGENPREHFQIFYSLADPEPSNPALPAVNEAPLNACSVTRWP